MDEYQPRSRRSFYLAAGVAVFCMFSSLWAFKLRFGGFWKKKTMLRRYTCSCGHEGRGSDENSRGESSSAVHSKDVAGKDVAAAERQSGASMMEQLVPEITTHTLSYLDHTSLCNLSMTNSSMRRAANDDNAWKALYHKDFTMEQDLIPAQGWKSYYAATKAIVNVNTEFCKIIRERSLPAMGRFWLHANYVKCIHSSGELNIGFNAVMNSWAAAFNWGQGVALQIREVRARVSTDMAWVTMKAYIDLEADHFFMTNVYELHQGRWFMVHHHSTIMAMDGDPVPAQPNGFA